MPAKHVHSFPYFKKREGLSSVFPYDNPEEQLEQELQALGLTDENLALVEDLYGQRAAELKVRIEAAKAKALKVGVLIESIESIAYSDAKIESLEKVLERLEILEAQSKDLLIPWSKTQFMKALPWLAIGLMIVAFGMTAIASKSTSTQQPATEIEQ